MSLDACCCAKSVLVHDVHPQLFVSSRSASRHRSIPHSLRFACQIAEARHHPHLHLLATRPCSEALVQLARHTRQRSPAAEAEQLPACLGVVWTVVGTAPCAAHEGASSLQPVARWAP